MKINSLLRGLLFGLCVLCGKNVSAQITSTAHSTAAAAGLVIKSSRGTLLSVSGYNAKGSAQFIQIHDSATVPADLTAEVSTCKLGARTPAQLANKYFTISSPTVDYYVWFNLDAGGVDPLVAGKTAIPVAISTGDSDTTMATAAAAAIDALAAFVSTAGTTIITITNAVSGAATDIAVGNSVTTVAVTTQGASTAIPVFVITAAASSNFSFTIPDGGVGFSNGISVCNSSAYATKVAGSADCFFTGVAAAY